MTTELFSVLDAAAGRFMDPFCGPTVDFAIRGFREACRTDGHQFNKFPEDYVLYHVGSFDGDTAELTKGVPPKIAIATSFVGGGNQLDLLEGGSA